MMAVMIGIDPHQGSHTAVAISAAEEPLGDLRVRASAAQAGALAGGRRRGRSEPGQSEGRAGWVTCWAGSWSPPGSGCWTCRPSWLPGCGCRRPDTNKNDPDDALSVAVAALRPEARRPVLAEDHAAVLKVWSKRHRDLARSRNQVACRLHSVLCELRAGGVSKEITAAQAARILEQVTPSGPVGTARHELAGQFLEDLRGLDAQLRETRKKLAAAVRAADTSLTGVFGFGPAGTGTVIGGVTGVTRFPGRDHFASCNGTAPAGVPSGNRKIYRLSLRGNRRINHALHMAAITQIRHAHSDGLACYDRKIAEGKTCKEALRCLKRRISDTVFARLQADARQATATAAAKGPGGQPGNDSDSSAAGLHPVNRLFGQATPEPSPTLRPASPASHATETTSKKTRRNP
jgi:transposase